jgi:hypothetical protein
VEQIRWRLWHGQVQQALDLIGDTVAALDAVAAVASPAGGTAGKVVKLLRGLETYVAGQPELIIDCATARHDAEPISTAPTESHCAMAASSPDGCESADALRLVAVRCQRDAQQLRACHAATAS